MNAAILGTTGYTGQILLRLLASHPEVSEVLPVSSSRAGTPLREIDPGLPPSQDTPLLTAEEAAAREPDVVFAALPHLKSAEICRPFLPGGDHPAVVIDLSADFRHRDAALFEAAYGQAPPRPDLQNQAVYGLSEAAGASLAGADIIANPGCYPTATLLPLLPLLAEGLIAPSEAPLITVNALSGISGAGRKARINSLFTERSENTGAYAPGLAHRHAREIAEQLAAVSTGDSSGTASRGAGPAPAEGNLLFTPHLVPLRRGMAVTTAVTLTAAGQQAGTVAAALDRWYRGRPFIHLNGSLSSAPPAAPPQTADVRGSNRCDIAWKREGRRLLLFSAIDNLVKGASGQAVQNMNLRFGLDETAGLPLAGEV